ncbi:MAG: 2OG-Fe(II) oxygenase, partial [Janthinobacterium lividum]
YDRSDSRQSGVFTQKAGGPSQTVTDTNFKRRRDCNVRDAGLVQQIQARIVRRVVPEIRKVYQFEATQLERLILASYDASDHGCFGAHRDNTVTATEHRRFAVSINLNQDFDGGELVFPEFGRRGYRPPAGGAIVFSCSLMHLVTPVTAGRRIACLPFVYDEAAATLKRANVAAAQESRSAVR